MVNVGVPKANVYAKMASDGMSPKSVDRFRCVFACKP